MQEGLVAVPGSTNPAHIQENISIFDFELSDDEIEAFSGGGYWEYGDCSDRNKEIDESCS